MITVVGGVYCEECNEPVWDFVLGSGGRAAIAIGLKAKVELITALNDEFASNLEIAAGPADIDIRAADSPSAIRFHYTHPLAFPTIHGAKKIPDLPEVTGDKIVVFDMIEGRPRVNGRRVVYDPQNGESPTLYSDNGSKAEELIYCLNNTELILLSKGHSTEERAQALFTLEPNLVSVVVKNGPLGAYVFARGASPQHIPAYRSARVFKIGSGDIFTATFSYFWLEENTDPLAAADLASRNVAAYAETKDPVIPNAEDILRDHRSPMMGEVGRVYLAGPFFSLEQRWLIDEIFKSLSSLGTDVFSPVHHVGFGRPEDVAIPDIRGLEGCDSVLAVLNGSDPGTIFEVGYAIALGKKVSIIAERTSKSDLTMMIGTGCKIYADMSSAIYNSVWDSFRVNE